MKFWKKIFLYSVVLFLILMTCSGAILIENTFEESLQEAIRGTINQFTNIENNLYLNTDYIIDVDVTDKESIRKWADIIIKGYILNQSNEIFYVEFYTEDNQLILSDWDFGSEIKRPEIAAANENEKTFIIREIEGRRYVFISSIINLKNKDFKFILSKDIESVYIKRVGDYKFFLIVNIFILFVLATGMFVISKNLTEPIVRLSEISKKIAKGDYKSRVIENEKNDEISILERNFNKMIDVIEDNIMELRYHNESKQRFIDSLNHEIKTPITSIIGYSELLLRSKVNEETQRKALMYINSEARRLELLNSTLLKLTLIREEEIHGERISLLSCAKNASNTLKYKLETKKIKLVIAMDEVIIEGDKSQIEVLLINLLDNAVKASSENSIIEILGKYYEKEEQYLLKVKDYGIGIEKEELGKILEPFYMVDKARIRKDNGIGLGLAICNEICQKHKITIEFISEKGKGTEVVIKFDKGCIRK